MDETIQLLRDPASWVVFFASLMAFARGLDAVLPRLQAYAAGTPNQTDDRLVVCLRKFSSLLNLLGVGVRAFLPHSRFGSETPGRTATNLHAGLGVITIAIIVAVASTASGCGGNTMRVARVTAAASAYGVLAADVVASEAYVQLRSDVETDEGMTAREARRRQASLDRVNDAIRIARPALLQAEQALDQWEAGAPEDRQALACAVDAVTLLIRALSDAGLDAPPKLLAFLRLGELVPGQGCIRANLPPLFGMVVA